MSITFSVTREDLLRSKTVQPGWYQMTVKSVTRTAAKTDGSDNTNVELQIVGGNFDGVLIRKTFSEKAQGFAVSYIEATMGKKMSDQGGTFDMEASIGKTVEGHVSNKMYQDRLTNQVDDFRPSARLAAKQKGGHDGI